jgi:anthranilate synthase component 1
VLETHQVDDPLAFIEAFKARFRVPELDNLPRFHGGLVGYFGYDTIAYIEPKLRNTEKADPLNTPDIMMMVSDEVVVFDNLRGRMYVVVTANIERGDTLETVQARMRRDQRGDAKCCATVTVKACA